MAGRRKCGLLWRLASDVDGLEGLASLDVLQHLVSFGVVYTCTLNQALVQLY